MPHSPEPLLRAREKRIDSFQTPQNLYIGIGFRRSTVIQRHDPREQLKRFGGITIAVYWRLAFESLLSQLLRSETNEVRRQ